MTACCHAVHDAEHMVAVLRLFQRSCYDKHDGVTAPARPADPARCPPQRCWSRRPRASTCAKRTRRSWPVPSKYRCTRNEVLQRWDRRQVRGCVPDVSQPQQPRHVARRHIAQPTQALQERRVALCSLRRHGLGWRGNCGGDPELASVRPRSLGAGARRRPCCVVRCALCSPEAGLGASRAC